jgi:hypothetical protein
MPQTDLHLSPSFIIPTAPPRPLTRLTPLLEHSLHSAYTTRVLQRCSLSLSRDEEGVFCLQSPRGDAQGCCLPEPLPTSPCVPANARPHSVLFPTQSRPETPPTSRTWEPPPKKKAAASTAETDAAGATPAAGPSPTPCDTSAISPGPRRRPRSPPGEHPCSPSEP